MAVSADMVYILTDLSQPSQVLHVSMPHDVVLKNAQYHKV